MADHRRSGPAWSAHSAHSAHSARSVHSAHSAHRAHTAGISELDAHTVQSAQPLQSPHADAHSAHSARSAHSVHSAHSASSARAAVLFLAKLGLLLGALTFVQAIHTAVQNATASAWGLPPLRQSAGLIVLLFETAAGRFRSCGTSGMGGLSGTSGMGVALGEDSSHPLLIQAACQVAGPLAVWLLAGFIMMVQLRTVGLPRAVFSASSERGVSESEARGGSESCGKSEARGKNGWWGRKAERVSIEADTEARAENEGGTLLKERLVGRGGEGLDTSSTRPVVSSSGLAACLSATQLPTFPEVRSSVHWFVANDDPPGTSDSPEQGDLADSRRYLKRISLFEGQPAEVCHANELNRSIRTAATYAELETVGNAEALSSDRVPDTLPDCSPDCFPPSPRAPFRTRSIFRAARASVRLLLHVISRLRPGDLLLPYRPLHCLALLYRSGLSASSTAHLAWLALTGSVIAAALGLLPLYPGTDGVRLLCLALEGLGIRVSCEEVERWQLAGAAAAVSLFTLWDAAALWGDVVAVLSDAAWLKRAALSPSVAAASPDWAAKLWTKWHSKQRVRPVLVEEKLDAEEIPAAEPLPDISVMFNESVMLNESDVTSGLGDVISHGFWRRRRCACEFAQMVLRSACHEGSVGTCQYGGGGGMASSRYYLRKAHSFD